MFCTFIYIRFEKENKCRYGSFLLFPSLPSFSRLAALFFPPLPFLPLEVAKTSEIQLEGLRELPSGI